MSVSVLNVEESSNILSADPGVLYDVTASVNGREYTFAVLVSPRDAGTQRGATARFCDTLHHDVFQYDVEDMKLIYNAAIDVFHGKTVKLPA